MTASPSNLWVRHHVYLVVWSVALLSLLGQPLHFARAQMSEDSSSTGCVPSPTVCHFSLTTTNPSLSLPDQLIVDSNSIYVVNHGDNRVVKLDRNGTQLLVFTINPPIFSPVDIALDAADQLYVLETGRVVIFSPNATQLQAVQPVYPSLSNPWGLVVDSAGDLIITELPGGYVYKFSVNGSLLQSIQFAPFDTPFNLALDSDENVYFSSPYNNRVVKLTPNFTVVTQYTTSDPPLNSPYGVFVASDSSIYIADSGNNRVVQLDANGTQLAVFATDDPPMNGPGGVAVDADGDVIVSDYNNNRLVVFSTSRSACQLAQSSSSSSSSVTSPLPSPSTSSSSSVITSATSSSTTFLSSPYTGGEEDSSSSSSTSSAAPSTASSAPAALSSSAFLTSQYGGGSSSSSFSGIPSVASSNIGISTSSVLSSTSALPAPLPSSSSSSELSGGAIAGIVLSVVVVLLLLCLVLAWRLRARWSRWSVHSRFEDDDNDEVEFTGRAKSPSITKDELLSDCPLHAVVKH